MEATKWSWIIAETVKLTSDPLHWSTEIFVRDYYERRSMYAQI